MHIHTNKHTHTKLHAHTHVYKGQNKKEGTKNAKYYHSKERSGRDTSFTWTLPFTEEEVEKFIHSLKIYWVYLRRVVNRFLWLAQPRSAPWKPG